MGRSGNKKSSRHVSRSYRNSNNAMARIVTVPVNEIISPSITSGTTVSVIVRPSLDQLVANISNNYEFYRFTQLKFTAMPVGALFAYTYYPSNESPSVADSFATVSLSALCRMSTQNMSVPSVLKVPRGLLYESPENWWSVSTSSTLNQQGRFVVAANATVTQTYQFRVTGFVQFKSPSLNGTDLRKGPINLGSICSCENCNSDQVASLLKCPCVTRFLEISTGRNK